MRVEDWTAIWYKCLACQRCFQFPDRLIAHKNLTECGNVYKNELSFLLDCTSDHNDNIAVKPQLQNSQPLKTINEPLIKIEQPEELPVIEGSSGIQFCAPTESLEPDIKLHPSNPTKQKYNLRTNPARQDVSISKTTTQCTTLRKGSVVKRNKCYFCNKKLQTNQGLQVHLRIHTKEMPFNCITCGQRFIYNYKLDAHNLKNHQTQSLNIFKIRRILRSKQYAHRQTPVKPNLRSFKRRRLVHGRLKFLKCKNCGKQFNVPSEFKKHQLIHSEVKPFECKVCGKCYSQLKSMKNHMLTHTGLKPCECQECGMRFTLSWNLKRHMQRHIHTGVKPFECKECGKHFTQSPHMKKHMRTHSHN